MLNQRQRECLLRIARESLVAAAQGGAHTPTCDDPELCGPGAAFVTLKKRGELRGCIGSIRAEEPLYLNVAGMARAAALEDFRFLPVQASEVAEISIEISCLTPPRRVSDVEEIEVGVHGLIVQQGQQRGLLLPQVAPEWGWDREEFLEHTCLKAGLPREAWRQGTMIFAFTAEVFGEEE